MKLKSLNEINQEFYTDWMTNRQETENSAVDTTEPITIKIDPPEVSFNEPDLDELYIRALNRLNDTNKISQNKEKQEIKKEKKKRRNIFAVISDVLFYLAIFTILIVILTSGQKDGAPKMFMGLAYFTVVSPSMQEEIPKGSLIFVKQTDPRELNIGDNITFMKDANTTVTHKITDIYDNYLDSGVRGFQTKGVNNVDPDKEIVHEESIVGKVIIILPGVGAAIAALRANIYIVFIIFGLCIALSFLLRALFANPDKSKKSEKMERGERPETAIN